MASNRPRRRLWTAAVAATVLVTLLYLSGGVVSGLRSAANAVVAPFAWTVNLVARPIGHFFSGAIDYSDVVAQNQRLRYQLGRAEQRANQVWALERQLGQITSALNVPFVGSLPTVAAQVTTVAPTTFAATVDISKGRADGVLVGMPVVGNGGLIGTVIGTGAHSATVRLITDTASQVGVTWGKGTSSLVISGRGVNNALGASSVPLTTSLKPGTILSTDSLQGGLFPPGLPVATVSAVNLTPGAATYDLVVEPSADLAHLLYVDVVLWEPST